MGAKPLVDLVFGRGGSALTHTRAGWAAPETGFCWTIGTGASLRVAMPAGAGLPCLEVTYLEMWVNPHLAPGMADRRLTLRVNGVTVGEDWLRGEGELGYELPARALSADGTLAVELAHDVFPSPAELHLSEDARPLGFMVRTLRLYRLPPRPRADVTVLPPVHVSGPAENKERILQDKTGLVPRDLLLCFESLGHNCEFGLLQRHLGAEPIDLLRFAGITLDDLLAGLRDEFARIGQHLSVLAHPTDDGRAEYIIRDEVYRIGLHSFDTTDRAGAEEVRAKHTQRLAFTRRLFMDRLRAGERLLVFQRPGQITRAHALVLLNLLQGFGPNALLYVDQDPSLPSGAVEQVGHGLFHGKLDRMAPAGDAGHVDLLGWLSVCANAYQLWRKFRIFDTVL